MRCIVSQLFNFLTLMHLLNLSPFHPPVKTGGYSCSTPLEFLFRFKNPNHFFVKIEGVNVALAIGCNIWRFTFIFKF